MNTIAVDAMGGDSAPEEIVKGAIKAKNLGIDVILSGDKNLIEPFLNNTKIPIVHYPEVISMDENPARAIRSKKNSSIVGAMQLVKDKKASAVFSAGSTGASLVAAIAVLGKIKGVIRPAIASVLPSVNQDIVLLDSGASLDVKPKVLLQFAAMGSKFAEVIFDLPSPRIGLLNNGEEASKGRDLEKSTYKLLKSSKLNFIGNIEGKDFASDSADVFVTDGFTGNIVLKTMEGTAKLQQSMIKKSLKGNLFKPLLLPVNKALQPVRDRLDPDKTNGAYLLGVNGIVTIAHGASSSEAVMNSIIFSSKTVEKGFISKFAETISEI
ncbi:phosphate acyltransferase PlsX [Acidimicrobiia bacterium]|jgi:glycerol-3-phosphate acyltransferase PlsX|nr:phosphate acyltransferase PlsX [Acidimicrobiia bacterium]MDC1070883.1 phosphate acyltransferase PlsX [Acidimicrobiia bacterium]|tara:strand:+ start:10802 stop:11773 length:972 start_codon:yes stop_codon:yes gene_type:complete